MSQLPSSLFLAAIRLGPSSITWHPSGVVVQFSTSLAFQAFIRLPAVKRIPHQVAVSGGCWSVAFGGLPAGGL